jgi:hypothetical protein
MVEGLADNMRGVDSGSALLLRCGYGRLPALPNTTDRQLAKYSWWEDNSRRRQFPMSPKTPIPICPEPLDAEVEEEIRQRAYQLYEEHGRLDGHAMEDWLIAEDEVLGSRQAKLVAA